MAADQTLRDLDPGNWPASWRRDWEINEHCEPMPRAWHRSGLCFYFEFDPTSEDWSLWDDEISQSRIEELRGEMDSLAYRQFMTRLWRQAKALWFELGYEDGSSTKQPRPSAA